MPFALYECTENDHAEMDKIWDSVWSELDVKRELKKVEDSELLPIFFKYLPKHGKILEGGCGLGQWVIYLKNKGYDMIGIDFAEETVKAVKKHDKSLPIELGDVKKISFSDNYLSAYISLGVVEHFTEGPHSALSEARRVLKKDGALLISVPVFNLMRRFTIYFETLYKLLRENRYIRKAFGKSEYPQKYFVEYRYAIREFERVLKKEGFFVIAKFTLLHNAFSLFNYFLEPPAFLLKKDMFFYVVFDKFSKFCKEISEWIAPHQVLWVCKNDK